MGKSLATGPYHQCSGEKKHLNPGTILPCLNIETISTERLQEIKLPPNELASDVQIPMQKRK
jgi:hypothetical protein